MSKSTDPNSCPYGYKIWSPRTEKDWMIVYDAMGTSITNKKKYPSEPYLIVDVTKPLNDSCAKETCKIDQMKSTNPKNEFRTSDGSAWWIDCGELHLTSAYTANCYLNITRLHPVRFEYAGCAVNSKSYLCQPIEKGTCFIHRIGVQTLALPVTHCCISAQTRHSCMHRECSRVPTTRGQGARLQSRAFSHSRLFGRPAGQGHQRPRCLSKH